MYFIQLASFIDLDFTQKYFAALYKAFKQFLP